MSHRRMAGPDLRSEVYASYEMNCQFFFDVLMLFHGPDETKLSWDSLESNTCLPQEVLELYSSPISILWS